MASIEIGFACHHPITDDPSDDVITVLAALRVPLDAGLSNGDTVDFVATLLANEEPIQTYPGLLTITDTFEETESTNYTEVNEKKCPRISAKFLLHVPMVFFSGADFD